MAASWPVVLVIRFFDRIGKGIRSAPRDTLIASAAPAGSRGAAYGLHRAFDNAGAVLGPLLASGLMLVLDVPLRMVFALSAVPAALSLAVLIFAVKETKAEAAPPVAKDEAPAPLPPRFKRALVPIVLFTLAASSDTFLLLKARQVGVAPALLPILWAFGNAVRAGLGRWGGGLSDRFGRRSLLLVAWLLYAACYGTFAFVTTPLALVLVFAFYSAYAALSEGTERALVADVVPAGSRGRAFGWFYGLTGMAALPASAGFGFLWERFGSRVAFLTGAALATVAVASLLLLVPKAAARRGAAPEPAAVGPEPDGR
jgi:MFS family permease